MASAHILLAEIVRVNIPRDPSGLAKDVLNLIGNDPIDLTKEEEEYVQSFIKLHANITSQKPSWGQEGRYADLQAIMILSSFIQRKR